MQRRSLAIFTMIGSLLLTGCGSQALHPVASSPKVHHHTKAKAKPTQVVQKPKPKWQTPIQPHYSCTSSSGSTVYYRNQAVVLMFHQVSLHGSGDVITPAAFAGDLQVLKKDHFHVITTTQLGAFLQKKACVPPNAVVITFDDGYQGVYKHAFPVLKKMKLPFTLFQIAGWVSNPKHPGMLTWPELKTMVQSGYLTIGSHTYNSHGPIQTGPHSTGAKLASRIYNPKTGQKETWLQYEKRIKADLSLAKTTLQDKLHQKVTQFAYPFGAYRPKLIAVLRQLGYKDMYTTVGWSNTPGESTARIFRINVGNPKVGPQNIASSIRYIASLTQDNTHYKAPVRVVPHWHF